MNATRGVELAPGLVLHSGYLDRHAQAALLDALRTAIGEAPLYRPTMPKSGVPFSVQMTNCGGLGWFSDDAGYRYLPHHPATGRRWPPIPAAAMQAWRDVSHYPHPPDACLVNFYADGARMGLHQDRDEEGFAAPVVSLSLGDTCVFRYGGVERRSPTRSVKLQSGDALVLGGASRLAFHGVDRVIARSSTLLPEGGRFNLTLRRVSGEPLESAA